MKTRQEHHAFCRALLNFTSSIVCGVSFADQEIGRQTEHSLPAVTVVFEQLAASNPLASARISLNRIAQPPVLLGFLFAAQRLLAVAAGFPVCGE
jgi:hypothetical protein